MSNLKDHASKSLSLYAVVVNGSFHCISGGIAFRPTTFDTKEEAEEQAAFVRNNFTCGGDCRVVELSPASHPAPAGGKGVEELLVILELDLKGLAKFTERRLLVLESQPALSVPAVDTSPDLPESGYKCASCGYVDPDPIPSVLVRAGKCRKCCSHPRKVRYPISERWECHDCGEKWHDPASPQRTPAEVEGGESVGMRYARKMWSEKLSPSTRNNVIAFRLAPDGYADVAHFPKGSEMYSGIINLLVDRTADWIDHALSTAPRAKVPTRDEIDRCIGRWTGSPASSGPLADAILALFTEGNTRG